MRTADALQRRLLAVQPATTARVGAGRACALSLGCTEEGAAEPLAAGGTHARRGAWAMQHWLVSMARQQHYPAHAPTSSSLCAAASACMCRTWPPCRGASAAQQQPWAGWIELDSNDQLLQQACPAPQATSFWRRAACRRTSRRPRSLLSWRRAHRLCMWGSGEAGLRYRCMWGSGEAGLRFASRELSKAAVRKSGIS